LNNVLICLLAISTLTTVNAQDDFFTPSYSIGGYGELHYSDSIGEQILDFHRFIIYYGYNWTEKWSFKSEVELEHNFVSGDNGELELEQAFVNYHAGSWGFQGGVILLSVGLINEYHEPPLFLSVERPDYNKRIIPTTWFANGIALYGKYSDFNFRFALLEDLNGDDISDGIRSARGKGFKTTAENWTKNFSINYTGINGLRIGGSLTMNDAPRSESYTNDEEIEITYPEVIGVTLMELNVKYDANNIYGVIEYGKIKYTNNNYWVNQTTDDEATTDVDESIPGLASYESSSGYYVDLGYNVASFFSCDCTIMPWIRLSNVSRADGIESKTYDIFRIGLTFKPINNVAFKFDYGKVTTASETDNPTTEINIGIGYNF